MYVQYKFFLHGFTNLYFYTIWNFYLKELTVKEDHWPDLTNDPSQLSHLTSWEACSIPKVWVFLVMWMAPYGSDKATSSWTEGYC